ncbi:MAG: hypothetical protein KDA45_17390, partial [Planctomycetales bacterium]|nr:hypothetical protein [Planctomycetales bacterium]
MPNRDIGFLLIGHGTRNSAGQAQLREVHGQFAELLAPAATALAFLELAEPSIGRAVAALAGRGVRQLVAVPALLFSAGHAERDIPRALAEAAQATNTRIMGQSAPLESSQAIVELSALRFRQALAGSGLAAGSESLASAEPGSGRYASEPAAYEGVALAMIGRGSRSPSATRSMRQFSQRRRQITPVSWLDTGFITAQRPTVDEVLYNLSRSACATVVVQPHLLFEGELVVRLREQVAACQRLHPAQRWLVPETLGTD